MYLCHYPCKNLAPSLSLSISSSILHYSIVVHRHSRSSVQHTNQKHAPRKSLWPIQTKLISCDSVQKEAQGTFHELCTAELINTLADLLRRRLQLNTNQGSIQLNASITGQHRLKSVLGGFQVRGRCNRRQSGARILCLPKQVIWAHTNGSIASR
jgi:hypothetical protein